jgi:hypothetical protein
VRLIGIIVLIFGKIPPSQAIEPLSAGTGIKQPAKRFYNLPGQ